MMNQVIMHTVNLSRLVTDKGFPSIEQIGEEKKEGGSEMVVDWLNTVGDMSTDPIVNFAKTARAYAECKKIAAGISEKRLLAGHIDPGLFQTLVTGNDNNLYRTMIGFGINALGLREEERLGLLLRLYLVKRDHHILVPDDDGDEEEEEEEYYLTDAARLAAAERKRAKIRSMTPDQLLSSCRRRYKRHLRSKAMVEDSKIDAAEARTKLQDSLGTRVFFPDVYHVEHAHLATIPQQSAKQFLSRLDKMLEIAQQSNPQDAWGFESANYRTIMASPFSLDLESAKEDVFKWFLPRRYHIKDGFTQSVLDILLDRIVGADSVTKMKVHKLLNFEPFRPSTGNTSITVKEVLTSARSMLEQDNDEADRVGYEIAVWRFFKFVAVNVLLLHVANANMTQKVQAGSAVWEFTELNPKHVYLLGGQFYVVEKSARYWRGKNMWTLLRERTNRITRMNKRRLTLLEP